MLNYLTAILGFALSFWVAKHFGPEKYGIISSGILIGQLFSIIVAFGSERTLLRDLVQSDDPNRTLFGFIAKVVVCCIVTLPIAAIGIYLYSDEQSEYWTLSTYLLSGVFFGLNARQCFDANKRMIYHSAILLTEKIIYACLLVLCLSSLTPLTVAICFASSRLISMTFQWFQAGRLFNLKFNSQSLYSEMVFSFRSNLPVFGASVCAAVLTHLLPLSLKSISGSAELACFGIGFQVIAVVHMLLRQLVRLDAPKIAGLGKRERSYEEVAATLSRLIRKNLLVGLATSIPAAMAGCLLISTVLGPEFRNANYVLVVLSCWCLAFAPGLIVNQFALAFNCNRTYFWATVASATIAIPMAFLLIPKFGAVGCALTIALSHTASILIQWISVKKELRKLPLQQKPEAL